uniref:Iron-binding zinc finger CDGSH type domain-containing protein n=1 Tax=Leersia perrieri TaxID=77586 RepID=A0A0D9WYL7_9ORYZ
MATPFCAAAASCRLTVSPPAVTAPAAPARVRARRGMVAVRAEAGVGGINPSIRKEEAKVVDTVLAEELSKPLTPYCRCWRSGTFPLCDGSHAKHNKETGDNVGPLLVKK